MAILQSSLVSFGERSAFGRSDQIMKEAKAARKQTAFLSHSHLDGKLAKGVQGFLQSHGWDVYIDWDDTSMPDTPDRETANRLKSKIKDLDWFLFLATQNSMKSRWCPWEIGYADRDKPIDRILILPTSDGSSTHGSEYLQLYRKIDVAQALDGRSGLAAFHPSVNNGIMIWALKSDT